MKKKLIFLLTTISLFSFSQETDQLKQLLSERYPIKKSFSFENGPVLFYYPESDEPKIIRNETIKKILPGYDLYSINLFYHYDEHSFQCESLVLFNKKKSLFECTLPINRANLNSEFYALFIGKKISKRDLKDFANGMNEIFLNGTNLTSKSELIDKGNIRFYFFEQNNVNLYKSVEIKFKRNKIIEIK